MSACMIHLLVSTLVLSSYVVTAGGQDFTGPNSWRVSLSHPSISFLNANVCVVESNVRFVREPNPADSSASNTEVQNDGRIEIYDGTFLETSPLKIVGMLSSTWKAQDRPKRGIFSS